MCEVSATTAPKCHLCRLQVKNKTEYLALLDMVDALRHNPSVRLRPTLGTFFFLLSFFVFLTLLGHITFWELQEVKSSPGAHAGL